MHSQANAVCLPSSFLCKPAVAVAAIALLCVGGVATAVPFPGPDAFGYVGSEIPYNLRDVSGTGADIGLDDSDDATAVVPIGLSFDFYGVSYTDVEVSSNGFISFTPTGDSGCCSGDPIPTPGNIDNLIAAWWEDLRPEEGGTIRTETLGQAVSREFVVGFYEVRDYDDPVNSINTFEFILHEGSNDIEIQYGQVQWEDVDDKVAGIENGDGTDGIELIYLTSDEPGYANGDIVFEDEGYLFVVPEPATLVLLGLGGLAVLRRRRRVR